MSSSPAERATISKQETTSSDEEDVIVWDVPNPFAPPDPDLAHLDALIQAEIARVRRFESIGPLDVVYDEEDDDDDDADGDNDNDADDEDEEDDDNDADDEDEKPARIVLPRLLPLPLRIIPSPSPSPPPPSPSSSSDEKPSMPWADLAQVYNDIAEAEERATRKAKRDALRSRAKILAILGPEASVAL